MLCVSYDVYYVVRCKNVVTDEVRTGSPATCRHGCTEISAVDGYLGARALAVAPDPLRVRG